MSPSADDYRAEIGQLVKTGIAMIDVIQETKGGAIVIDGNDIYSSYQNWYSQASEIVSHLLPSRLPEFISMYEPEKNRKSINPHTYTIQDWLIGVRYSHSFDDKGTVAMKLLTQVKILESTLLRFDSILLNIKQLELADLFDSELDGARELLKAGFLRPAGVVAGVVLEKHLKELCASNRVKITKKKPTLADFNDALKAAEVFDTARWRFVGHLADIRNLCGHDKDKEPTKEQVVDLIDGVDKTIKTTG